jgi:hypothetical protein
MTIETKYNIGDEVWFRTLKFNVKARVIGVTINLREDGVIMEYGLERKGYYYQKREIDLFPTKEELLKSL